MGRKRTQGNRSAGGRKKKPTTTAERTKIDHGNDRVQALVASFRHKDILGGKAEYVDVFDGIGQLHAMGFLEGHGIDGKLMRDAGREYLGLYNYTYIALLPKGSEMERAYGGKPDLSDTRRDIRFAMLDDLLPVSSQERFWVHQLLFPTFGLDGTVPAFVDRLVNYKRAQWNLEVAGQIAGAEDFAILGCVLRGLFALADGAMPSRWRNAA